MDIAIALPAATATLVGIASLLLSSQAIRASRKAKRDCEKLNRLLAYRIGRDYRDGGNSMDEGKAHFKWIFKKDADTYQPDFEAGFAGQEFAE